jgi:hypothetical protein
LQFQPNLFFQILIKISKLKTFKQCHYKPLAITKNNIVKQITWNVYSLWYETIYTNYFKISSIPQVHLNLKSFVFWNSQQTLTFQNVYTLFHLALSFKIRSSLTLDQSSLPIVPPSTSVVPRYNRVGVGNNVHLLIDIGRYVLY